MASNAPRLYVTLYTDEDVYGQVAGQIRARGYDALSTFEANNQGLGDAEQLEFAISQGRTILTHNTADFESLHQQYIKNNNEHFGIVVSPQSGIGEIVRKVLRMLDQVDAEEMKNTFHHLGEFKELE